MSTDKIKRDFFSGSFSFKIITVTILSLSVISCGSLSEDVFDGIDKAGKQIAATLNGTTPNDSTTDSTQSNNNVTEPSNSLAKELKGYRGIRGQAKINEIYVSYNSGVEMSKPWQENGFLLSSGTTKPTEENTQIWSKFEGQCARYMKIVVNLLAPRAPSKIPREGNKIPGLIDHSTSMRIALEALCPSVETIGVNYIWGHILYQGTMQAKNKWQLEDGRIPTDADDAHIFALSYYQIGSCLDKHRVVTIQPVGGISMPEYVSAAKAFAQTYASECLGKFMLSFKPASLPYNYVCKTDSPCHLIASLDGDVSTQLYITRAELSRQQQQANPKKPVVKLGVLNRDTYIKAIFNGNFQEVKYQGWSYVYRIAKDSQTSAAMGVMMSRLANSRELTVLEELAGYYMLQYSKNENQCFNPGSFKRAFTYQQPDIVIYDGDGNEEMRISGGKTVDQYKLNKEFKQTCDAICNHQGSLNMVARGLNEKFKKYKVLEIYTEVDELMTAYQCDSTEVKRFESNLLNFIIKERAEPSSQARNTLSDALARQPK